MTNMQKAIWLQKNYGNYSLNWYLSDVERLNAIYTKEYNRYLRGLKEQVVSHQRAELESRFEKLRQAYRDYYHSDYDTDNAINRSETNARAQMIRHLWANQTVVA